MSLKKIVTILTIATYHTVISAPLVKAEQTVSDTSGQLKLYELPVNLGDGVLSLFGRSPDKKSLLKTPESLYLNNYSTTENADGTVTVTMDVYNQYYLDGFIETRNAQGQIIRSEKSIDAFKLPENFVESSLSVATNFTTGVNPLNLTTGLDPTTNINRFKKSGIKFTLKKGETANITVSSDDAFKYNSINLLFDYLGLFMNIGSLRDKDVNRTILSDYIENINTKSQYKGVTETLKDWILTTNQIGYENISDKDKITKILSSPSFVLVANQLIDYLTTKGFNLNDGVVTNIVKDQISDLITTGVDSSIPGFGKVAKITYLLTTSVNVLNKGMHISQLIKSPKPQVAFTIQSKNDGELNAYSQQTPNDSVQTSILQTQLTNITQSNISHIGSASTNFVRNPIQNKVTEQNAVIAEAKPQTIQEKNQYTNGQIIRTPFDITLTWDQNGSNPLDLDSHLATPNGQHVYFVDKGNLNSAPNAFLYRDSVPAAGRFGAEQTRVTKLQDGEYRFYIHNFSDGGSSGNTSNPNRLSNSSAQVKIFEGGKPLTNIPNDPNNYNQNDPGIQSVGNAYPNGTFNVPTNTPGNTWSVFRLNARTGILTPVNTFGNAYTTDVPKLR